MSFCVSCGKQAEDEDAFCIGCGQKLRSSDAQVGAPTKIEPARPIEEIQTSATSQPRQHELRQPVETMDDILREIRGKVGFHTSTSSEKITVDIVFPRTPADRAGIERGDVIVRVGDVSVVSMSDFTTAIQGIDVGQLFTLEVFRGQNSVVLTVDPNARPSVVAPPAFKSVQLHIPRCA
jgi:predicted metalloprotease with PDZ domain